MASAVGHFAVAVAGSTWLPSRIRSKAVIGVAAVLAVLPDADVVGFWLGVPYRSLLGHRGLSHSLLFAAVAATCVALILGASKRYRKQRTALAMYLFLVIGSHGTLDAITNGGLGVAFFAPFSGARFFFPWTPLEVSPLELRGLSWERLSMILASEAAVLAGPLILLAVGGAIYRYKKERDSKNAVEH